MKPNGFRGACAYTWVFSLFIGCLLGCGPPPRIIPVGTSVGPIQFDAIVEIIPPRTRRPETLFARYWVASNYFRLAVIWAEPRGRGLRFPVYPQSLTAGSDERVFSMSHDIYPTYDVSVAKPIGDRGVFRCMFGDYPITNICYAEREAAATRLYRNDLEKGMDRCLGSNGTFTVAVIDSNIQSSRAVSNVRVGAHGGVVDSVELFGQEHRLLKKIEYEYDDKVDPVRLSRENVFLPEMPMKVGVRSGAINVSMADHKYAFSDFPIIHERGGRKCLVDYGQVSLTKNSASLPVLIEVRDAASDVLLRSVRMTNFQNIRLTSKEAEQAAEHYAGLTPANREYESLLNKYWGDPIDRVSEKDTETIRQLCLRFNVLPSAEENNIGEKLRRLNILMDLNFMIGNEGEVELNYEEYMKTLVEYHLSDMLLEGGYGVVEWAMEWSRYKDANRLLGLWLNDVSRLIDGDSALRFAEGEIRKKDFWTCFQFLRNIPDGVCSTSGSRFERAAMMCVSLHGLQELFRKRARLESGFPKMQVDLAAATTSGEQLDRLLAKALGAADRKLGDVANLSEFQKDLKRQLLDIEETNNKEETR